MTAFPADKLPWFRCLHLDRQCRFGICAVHEDFQKVTTTPLPSYTRPWSSCPSLYQLLLFAASKWDHFQFDLSNAVFEMDHSAWKPFRQHISANSFSILTSPFLFFYGCSQVLEIVVQNKHKLVCFFAVNPGILLPSTGLCCRHPVTLGGVNCKFLHYKILPPRTSNW